MKTRKLALAVLLAAGLALAVDQTASAKKPLTSDQKARILEVQVKLATARAERAEAEATFRRADKALADAQTELREVVKAIQQEAGCQDCGIGSDWNWIAPGPPDEKSAATKNAEVPATKLAPGRNPPTQAK